MRRKPGNVFAPVEQTGGAQQRFARGGIRQKRIQLRRKPRRADDAVHRVFGKAARRELLAQLLRAVEVERPMPWYALSVGRMCSPSVSSRSTMRMKASSSIRRLSRPK